MLYWLVAPPNPIRLIHPFHVHGHRMYIMEQGVFRPPLEKTVATLNKRLESGETLQRYLPKKDTVSVPTSGYTIVRILADNPGKSHWVSSTCFLIIIWLWIYY